MGSRNLTQLKAAVVKNDFEEESDIDSELTTWINDALLKVAARSLKCFIKKDSITTSLGENEYSLASDFRAIEGIYLEGSDGGSIDIYETTSLFYYDNYNVENATTDTYDISLKAVIHSPSLGIKFSKKFNGIYTIPYYYYHVPDRITDEEYPAVPNLYDYVLVDYANAQYRKRERDYVGYREEMMSFYATLDKWEDNDRNMIKGQGDMIEEVRSYYRKKGKVI